MPTLRPIDYMADKISHDFDPERKLVIGFAGKKGTGKDTVANILKKKTELQNLKVALYAFGDALKDEVSSTYGINRSLCDTQEGKLSTVSFRIKKTDPRVPMVPDTHIVEIDEDFLQVDITLRRLLQWYGTEYRRQQDPDYWTKIAYKNINELLEYYDIVMMTDLRFPNEYHTIRKYPNNYICRMNPYPNYIFTEASYHSSETALDTFSVDDDWNPRFGMFNLKLVANKIYRKVVVPFYDKLEKK